MRIKDLEASTTGKILFFAFLFYFSVVLLFKMFLFLNGPYRDDRVRKQYVVYLSEGEYDKAYQLLSERVRSTIGNVDDFKELNKSIEKKYEIFGMKEELIKSSVRINGNIVTFRIKTFFEGSESIRQILEAKAYLAIVDGKIDWVQSFGQEVVKITDESQA